MYSAATDTFLYSCNLQNRSKLTEQILDNANKFTCKMPLQFKGRYIVYVAKRNKTYSDAEK